MSDDNRRFPIGRTLTEFGDSLSDEEWENPSGAGEWHQIDITGGFIQEASTYTEELQQYLQEIRTYVVNTFDVAITAMTLLNDFMFFLPNFMNAVMTYLAQVITNALESYLRLGMHILVVPPDFGDAKFKGLPTTDLHTQAENVYKKFYDTSDPYIPYNVPFQQDVAEQMIESGAKVENKIEKFLLRRDQNSGESLSQKWLGFSKNETLRSDFTDYNQSIQNLAKPMGVYDAIFLYFSMDYHSNAANIKKFVDSIASLANLFQLEGLGALHDDFDNILFRSQRTKIKILTNQQMRDLPKESNTTYEKIDSYSRKQIRVDDELTDIIVVEADPFEHMPPSRFNRLKEFVENEIAEVENILKLSGEPGEENTSIETIEEQLRNNSSLLVAKKNSLKETQDEFGFYDIKFKIFETLDGLNLNKTTSETQKELRKVKNEIFELKKLIGKLSPTSLGYKEFKELITYLTTYVDAQQAAVNVSGYYNPGLADFSHTKYTELRNEISLTYVSITDIIKDPGLHIQDLQDDIESYKADISNIEDMISKEAKRIFEENLENLTESVKNKKEQLGNFEEKVGTSYIPYSDLTPENTTHIIEHIKNYKTGKKGLYQNHLQKFYQNNAHRSLWSYAAQAYGISSSVVTEENEIDFSQGSTEYNTGEIPNSVPTETFIYEFMIRRPPTSLLTVQSGMYVHLYKTGSRPGESTFLGDGFVVDDVHENLNQHGNGSWFGVNFSDLIGTTTAIKTLQKRVNAFANMFTPNNAFLREMIRVLKDIRQKIIEMIDIIDELLTILNLSIKFEGQVWGKYCREAGQEGYDKLAADLTSTVGYVSPIAKRNFEASKHSSISYYLRKIEAVNPKLALQIKNDIDQAYSQSSEYEKRKKEISEKSQEPSLVPLDLDTGYTQSSSWDVYGLKAETMEQAIRVKKQVLDEASELLSLKNSTLDLGSALFSNIANMDFVDQKTLKKNRQDNKVAEWIAKIYSELSNIEPTLSNEFGFSMVFLSYLPKSQPFYPVRYLAEMWGLIDENGNITTERMTPVDQPTLEGLFQPPKTQDFLKNSLSLLSVDENPLGHVQSDPKPIRVNFTPHRVHDKTNFEYVPLGDRLPEHFEEVSNSTDYSFRLKGQLNSQLHGIRLTKPLILPELSKTSAITSFTFRFEANISAALDASYVSSNKLTRDQIPKINKLELRMGVFYIGYEDLLPKNMYSVYCLKGHVFKPTDPVLTKVSHNYYPYIENNQILMDSQLWNYAGYYESLRDRGTFIYRMNKFQFTGSPVYNSGISMSHDSTADVSVLKFGSKKKKRFISEIISIPREHIVNVQYNTFNATSAGFQERSNVVPYILISYEERRQQVNMDSLIFTIHNKEIFFYRIR